MSLFRNKAPIWNPYIIELRVVSLTADFWMSRNAPPIFSFGGALSDVQKTAARETSLGGDNRSSINEAH